MKLAIMQPYLFPYIGYYQMINCVDTFVILDDVQYIRRGWINRNNISASDLSDEKHLFSVPVKKGNRDSLIKDIEISNEYSSWKIKFFKTLNRRYAKSNNFDSTMRLIRSVLDNDHDLISQLSSDSLMSTSSFLNIKTDFVFSSDIPVDGKFQEKLANICKYLGATHYINSIGGKELYTKEQFSDLGIELSFIKTNQPFNYFSIIDLLMRETTFSLNDYVLE
tara:strand:- start:437 stop:1102 length:666 start_codon:yes stop_codon:yes gene_type:complete